MAKSPDPWNGKDVSALVHTLELHQAELEAQNVELRHGLERTEALNAGLTAARDRYRALYEGAPAPFVTVNPALEIIEANAAAEALFGVPRLRLIGARADVFVGELRRAAFRAFIAEVFDTGHARSPDLLVTPDDPAAEGAIDVLVDGVLLPAVEGGDRHCVLAFIDISARLLQEHARRRAQDDVLGIVSHDLRGPLNAIVLACDGLKAGLAPALQAEHLDAVEKAAMRCMRLIKDLLAVVHIESGGLAMHPSWFDLGDLARVVLTDHRGAADAARVELTLAIGPGRLMVFADRDRVHQISANLVGNALVHGQGAPIEISVADGGDSVSLIVADQGPGIALAEQARVFDRFRQAGRGASGVGLGLAIVKGLATAHRGTVTLTSTPGLGARFEVTLPRGGL